MTEITNPRIIEAMTVKSGLDCLKSLNENDLKSLNMDWIRPRVVELKVECEKFLEKNSE